MTDFSYQLYSSRNFGPIEETLKMLSAAGYSQVEGYGGLFTTQANAADLAKLLDANGLSMPTAHIGLEMLEQNPDEVVAIAKTLGLKAVYVPSLSAEQRPNDAAGWQAVGARAQAALAPLAEQGIAIGWHNHDFEIQDAGNGQSVLDAMLSGGPDLKLELDLAWVLVGGSDPLDYIKKYADKISSVHIKDRAPAGQCEDEDGWADVGHGTMDWPAIEQALDATNIQYLTVEHDNPNDDVRFATRSIETIKKIWTA